MLPLSLSRWEAMALAILLPLHLVIHAALVVPDFGEPDGARMAIDAVTWRISGQIRLDQTDYRMRTSPLYIHTLERALRLGTTIRALPHLMATLSLVASTIALGAAYLLFRRLTGKPAAAVAAGVLAFMPGFFLSGSYGMAHGPALAAWLLALVCFSESLDDGRTARQFWQWAAASLVFVFVALGCKADLALNGAAFPGVVWLRGKLDWKRFAIACAIVGGGLLLQMLYARSLVVPGIDHARNSVAGRFQHENPFSARFLKDKIQTGAITHSPGPFVFAVALFAMVAHVLSPRNARLGLVTLAWATPAVVFWAFIMGNSARHNASALPPAALAVGVLVVELAGTPVRTAALTALVVVLNYLSDTTGDPVGFWTYMPKSNLVQLSSDVADATRNNRQWAAAFGQLGAPKKAVVARSSGPFAMFEALAEGERAGTIRFEGTDFTVTRKDGSVQTVKAIYATGFADGQAQARRLQGEGYVVHRREF